MSDRKQNTYILFLFIFISELALWYNCNIAVKTNKANYLHEIYLELFATIGLLTIYLFNIQVSVAKEKIAKEARQNEEKLSNA